MKSRPKIGKAFHIVRSAKSVHRPIAEAFLCAYLHKSLIAPKSRKCRIDLPRVGIKESVSL